MTIRSAVVVNVLRFAKEPTLGEARVSPVRPAPTRHCGGMGILLSARNLQAGRGVSCAKSTVEPPANGLFRRLTRLAGQGRAVKMEIRGSPCVR